MRSFSIPRGTFSLFACADVATEGAELAVLALHGGLADHRAALRLAEPLAGRHRVIAPDLRGAGQSRHAGPLGWAALAGDLEALLDHLRVARAIVIGTSMGSGVALRFALDAAPRCAGLVLAQPMYLGDQPLEPAQREAISRMSAFAERALVEGIDALLPLYDGLPAPLRAHAVEMAAGFDPASVAATTRLLASGLQPFAGLADLASIATPALVVPGTDPQHPRHVADAYAKAMPRVTTCEAGAYAAGLRAFVAQLT